MLICVRTYNGGCNVSNVPYVGQWQTETVEKADKWLDHMEEAFLRRGYVVLDKQPTSLTMRHEDRELTEFFFYREAGSLADLRWSLEGLTCR